jgi:crossover junction endodeoxyribonuclease RuvC
MTEKNKTVRIMGIDPGLANLGWGVIETSGISDIKLVDYGAIRTKKNRPSPQRLDILYRGVCKLIEKYRPSQVAVEDLFFSRNTKTAIKVAEARGAALVALNHCDVTVVSYTPLEIKKAIVGYGKADKKQVQFMVKNFLKLESVPNPDHASDALAAAICHNNSRDIKNLYQKGKQKS